MKNLFYLLFLINLASCSQETIKSIESDDSHFSFIHQESPSNFYIPVNSSNSTLSNEQKRIIDQTILEFNNRRRSKISVYVPDPSTSEADFSRLAEMLKTYLHHSGIKKNEINFVQIQNTGNKLNKITVSVHGLTGIQRKNCGNWPQDILNMEEMQPYANFGCSVTNNLAAQMDNVDDQFKPRKISPPDGERVNMTLEKHRIGKMELGSELKR
ncbi:CpaD family pilus assembly lipoprotein [Ochrobactrum sp. Marseille-Q0166]|uniref:CpaD family pilus assembly lipoprotein n=1 Tax=Ochrobactrum sp. Marseille-Q0166 TaxID=2761105 RepID=UPI0016567082|nr:CpaD family pilus assembly lipoprotein [Ochrobactrum sp. Marseille-Q0166]MBC8719082.1 CpaD family pilus assembly lipoprotein [Ochrobactrum sp. Marseille-Q0166]